MNDTGGFVKIWRGVFGHPVFRHCGEEAAFIWMIARAAWQPTRVRYKERIIHLKRGQLALSQRDFCRGFLWSKGTYYRFIERLKSEAMVGADVGTGVTIITICNYNEYQAVPDNVGAHVGAHVGAQAGHKRGTEQRKEERKKDSPPTPPRGKTSLAEDWKPCPVADLPKMAKAAATQWPAGLYEKEAEKFATWATGNNRMKADWHRTWANWILNADDRWQETRKRGIRMGTEEGRPLWEQRRDERMAKEGRA